MPIAINPNVHISGDLYVTLDNEEVLVKGTVASGDAVSDAPVLIGAEDPSGDVIEIKSNAAGQLIVDVLELPDASALADNMGNPTTTLIGACNMVFDGTQWDRVTLAALADNMANPSVTSTGAFMMGWDVGGSNWDRIQAIAGAMVVDTELPAAGVLGDNMANPTTPLIGACNMVYDGAQWDRVTLAALADAYANPSVTGTGAFGMIFNPTGVDWDRMISVEKGDAALQGLLATGGYVYNGATWDRLVEGNVAGSVFVDVTDRAARLVGVVDTELPAAGVLADNMANPTTPLIGACNMVYDGTQWDRVTLAALTDTFANPSVTGTGAFGMVYDNIGGSWDRLHSMEAGDASAAAGLLASGLMLYNGATFDMAREGAAGAGGMLVDVGDRAARALGVVDTELPAAGALADNMANPTTPLIGACNMVWDGGFWDRVTLVAIADGVANPATTGSAAYGMVWHPTGTDWDRVISAEEGDGVLTGLPAMGMFVWNGAAWDMVHEGAGAAGSVLVDTELPAAAALADNMGNPTTPLIGACNMVFDGTNWDRVTLAALTDAFANPSVTGTGAFLMGWNTANWDRLVSSIANGLEVDVTRVSGAIDTELPAAAVLSDAFANPTAPAVGAFLMGYDSGAGDWERVHVTPGTGHLDVAIQSSVGLAVTADTELPAAAALQDAAANPTTPMIGANLMGWNPTGGDWDRLITVEKGDAALVGLLGVGGYVYNGTTWDRATEGAAPGSARVDPYYDPTRAVGTSAANTLQTVSTATEPCKILFVTCKWSAAVTKDVTITLNAGAGGAYDTLLQTIVFTNETDGVWFPDSDVIIMNDDQLDVVAPAGGGGITSAVQIYTQPVAA